MQSCNTNRIVHDVGVCGEVVVDVLAVDPLQRKQRVPHQQLFPRVRILTARTLPLLLLCGSSGCTRVGSLITRLLLVVTPRLGRRPCVRPFCDAKEKNKANILR